MMCLRACGHIVTACIAASMGGAQAQVLDALDAIIANNWRLKVQVAMDRSVYFPSEAALVTITVSNPTADPLQVFTPFLASTGCLEVAPGDQDGVCNSQATANTPTTIMQPGEERRITLNSYDHQFGTEVDAMPGGGAPRQSGQYRLIYDYTNASQPRFQVVRPRLEAAAMVRVADITDTDETGKPIQFPGFMHVFAVEWQGQSFICVTRESSRMNSPVRADALGNLDDAPEIFTRIATSTNPVDSMAATADAAGNLTIHWQDSEGNQQTVNYAGPSRPASTAVEITTVPAGLSISVDGIAYATPHTFEWAPGSMHSLAAQRSTTNSGGEVYAWTNWSDDFPSSHEIFAPADATTYTAYFVMAYQLTLEVAPAHAGSITPWETAFSPGVALGLYPPGSTVKLSVRPVTGYTFSGWTGSVADAASPQTSVVMNGPQTGTANFMANVAAPEIDPPLGTYITPPLVTIRTRTPGATIRYTMDGSTPTETSGTLYTGMIPLKGTTTIKAIAYAKGMVPSEMAAASITIEPLAGAPLFSPAAGTYRVSQTVTLVSLTSGASIYYTLDGSMPTPEAGTLYQGPFAVSSTTTVRAVAYGAGMAHSGINSATYIIGTAAMASPPSPNGEQREPLGLTAAVTQKLDDTSSFMLPSHGPTLVELQPR
jgi:uncharacterized repeat protein (TIGR02543 family)